MDLWFEKYRPMSVDDMVISELKRNALKTWFKEFQEGTSAQCALLFTGPPGLGKTSLAHAILKEYGYNPKEFNASDIRSKSQIFENLNGLINISDVNRIVNKNIKTVGIIMDEVDGMFKGDRGGVDELLSFISIPSNRKRKSSKNIIRVVPIICICNIGSIKKDTIKQLQKECFEVSFSLPSKEDMMKIVNKVSHGENLNITLNTKNEIIEYSQGDFRRLISILEFLFIVYGVNITSESVNLTYNILCKKERDLHITDSVQKLINEKLTGHEIHCIYDGDKSKTPMVMHQNYLRAVAVQKTTAFNRLDGAIRCIDSLVISDIIEKTMYNNQSWYLQPIQGFTCALIPNYYINRYPKSGLVTATWASILSINSQSQNLRKNIYEVLHLIEHTQSYTIQDIQHLIEVIFHNFIQGNTEAAIRLIVSYSICNFDEFDEKKKALLVIDKIAKYIKISPLYNQWTKFCEDNKSDKKLDTDIKLYLKRCNNGMKVTTSNQTNVHKYSNITCTRPAIKSKQEQTELVQQRQTTDVKKKPTIIIRGKTPSP